MTARKLWLRAFTLFFVALLVPILAPAVWAQEILWTHQFGTSADDAAYGITIDSSGLYVAGVTEGALPGQTSEGEWDAFVRKYVADGNEVWTHQFGTSAVDHAYWITTDSSVMSDTAGP